MSLDTFNDDSLFEKFKAEANRMSSSTKSIEISGIVSETMLKMQNKIDKLSVDKYRLIETLSDAMKSQMLNRICQKGIVAKCLCQDCITDKAYALLAEMEAK